VSARVDPAILEVSARVDLAVLVEVGATAIVSRESEPDRSQTGARQEPDRSQTGARQETDLISLEQNTKITMTSERGANSQNVFVRLIDHVEELVVRRIGERDLYLGNRFAASPEQHSRQFEFVLSATHDRYPLTTHHRPLADGPENDWPTFAAAVDTARRLYRRDGTTLVHCKAGISRSSTLVATTLAAEEDRPFREALDIVHDARPLAIPHPALHEQAVLYLAARGSSTVESKS
jgi:hypothetical protein